MKKIIFLLTVVAFLFACETGNVECACYDDALANKKTTDECAVYVEGLSEEELKEKSNECFGETVEDLSGAGGL